MTEQGATAPREGAIYRLRQIENELSVMAQLSFSSGAEISKAKFEAIGIAASHLGPTHHLVATMREVDTTETLVAFAGLQQGSAVEELIGLIRAAEGVIELTPSPPSVAPDVCDPELWSYLQDLVRVEAWSLVPSAVVTFTEDWFRRRGGDPRHHKNGRLVGKDLFSRVLEDQPLGNEDGEQVGWKLLGMGLAQAIGNLHRHNVEQRADAEQLAWRVIGLASLLLGEMKRTHPYPTS